MSLIRSIEEKSRSAARSYYLGDNTVLAVILGELRMVLDSSDRGLVPHLMLDGFWESWVTAWIISNLRRGEVALNIGANCGYYAVMMARQVGSGGKVVAIEPNRTHVEIRSGLGEGETLVLHLLDLRFPGNPLAVQIERDPVLS